MKKHVMPITFTATVALIIGIIIAGNIYKSSIVRVSSVKAQPLTVDNSITCTGRVERIQSSNIYVPVVSTVNEICVKVGEEVKAGEKIMTVLPTKQQGEVISSSFSQSYDDYAAILSAFKSSSTNSPYELPSSMPSTSSAIPNDTDDTEIKDIISPTSGVVTSILVENQNYAYPGKPVMVIGNNRNLQVRLSVSESQIADIKVGQKAIISGVGFKNSSYSGIVKQIASEAKQLISATGQETVIEVIVSVNNPNIDIKPGFSAKAKIITSHNPNILIIPYEAVRADDFGNEYVFKIVKNKAIKTFIKTKREFESGFEVIDGLKKDDEIIINPDAVIDGNKVVATKKETVPEK